jgi:hypothetical protein
VPPFGHCSSRWRPDQPPDRSFCYYCKPAALALTATHGMPPPGAIMCTCGWCVIAEPHVCSTEVKPIPPSRFGVRRDRQQRLRARLEQEIVDHRLVLIRDRADPRRQLEHDVEVGHLQQLGGDAS